MNQELSEVVEDVKPQKKPIPLVISGMAYVTTEGFMAYCTTGAGKELPKNFKRWDNEILEQQRLAIMAKKANNAN